MSIANLIADLVRAGVDPELIGRVADAIARTPAIDAQAERRRAADRERKRAKRDLSSADSADAAEITDTKEIPPTPPKENTTNNISTNTREAGKGRGSRLPADFEPAPEILALGRERGLTDFEILDQLERFRDWANAATGQAGVKRDWQAAFRNWIKRAADDKQRRKPRDFTSNPIRDAFAEQRAFFGDDIESARYDSPSLSPIG